MRSDRSPSCSASRHGGWNRLARPSSSSSSGDSSSCRRPCCTAAHRCLCPAASCLSRPPPQHLSHSSSSSRGLPLLRQSRRWSPAQALALLLLPTLLLLLQRRHQQAGHGRWAPSRSRRIRTAWPRAGRAASASSRHTWPPLSSHRRCSSSSRSLNNSGSAVILHASEWCVLLLCLCSDPASQRLDALAAGVQSGRRRLRQPSSQRLSHILRIRLRIFIFAVLAAGSAARRRRRHARLSAQPRPPPLRATATTTTRARVGARPHPCACAPRARLCAGGGLADAALAGEHPCCAADCVLDDLAPAACPAAHCLHGGDYRLWRLSTAEAALPLVPCGRGRGERALGLLARPLLAPCPARDPAPRGLLGQGRPVSQRTRRRHAGGLGAAPQLSAGRAAAAPVQLHRSTDCARAGRSGRRALLGL
eukprot:m.193023 g.193023  ORF g.193023 m.193023 type:complete len:421 (-) comp17592_c0_seq9:4436-5698(-)